MASSTEELSAELDPEAVRVGATIKVIREAYGLKVGQLARAIGISHSYLSNVEAGRKHAPRALCAQIARVLDIPLAAIVSATYESYADTGDS